MEIRFLHTTSVDNSINKKFTNVITKNVVLKNDCDVLNPQIVLLRETVLYQSNYAYIPAFKRYYFITSIEILTMKTVMINFHVDVLESFKDDILKAKGYVQTSENANNYLDSTDYLEQENFECDLTEIECGFDLSEQSMILTTIGG